MTFSKQWKTDPDLTIHLSNVDKIDDDWLIGGFYTPCQQHMPYSRWELNKKFIQPLQATLQYCSGSLNLKVAQSDESVKFSKHTKRLTQIWLYIYHI